MREAGLAFVEISERIRIPQSTISSAWQWYCITGQPTSPKRPGRPQKTTKRADRSLVIRSQSTRELPY